MPRDEFLIWCDRCSAILAPVGQEPEPGQFRAAVLTDTVVLCERHAEAAPVDPAAVAKDDKETAKEERPVRRPARPRKVEGSAPAPARSILKARPAAPAPVPAGEVAARRRELAFAYAEKFGDLMAPPSSRRPIVTAAEIMATTSETDEEGPRAPFHPDVFLDSYEAASYIGTTANMMNSYRSRGGGPRHRKVDGRALYRVADIDAWLAARREQQPAPARPRMVTPAKEKPKAEPKPHRMSGAVAARTAKREERFRALVEHLDAGVPLEEAATRAGFPDRLAARKSAVQAGRKDLVARLTIGKKGDTKARRTRQEKSMALLDELLALLKAGTPIDEAIERSGYSTIETVRAACARYGRVDVTAHLPDRRGQRNRQKGEARLAELRRLLDQGIPLGEASTRAGYSHIVNARRALRRGKEQEQATETPESAEMERAA